MSEEVSAPRRASLLHIAPEGATSRSKADPSSVFLTALEVIDRYGWGRTKGYGLMRSDDFPRPIGGDRYRLDTLIAWENAQLSATRPTKPTPTLPARKRVRAS